VALGVYPDIGLAEAKLLRDEEKAKLRNGIDPLAHRRTQKLAKQLASRNSFEAIAHEWLEVKSGEWVPAHKVKIGAWLSNHVNPWIGARPIAELEAPELLGM